VFEDGKEYLTKNVEINVPCKGEKTGNDYSMICEGTLRLDRETSTAIIDP
jgi:flagellar basal body rod protein FlgF